MVKIEAGYIPNLSTDTVIKIVDALDIGLEHLVGRKLWWFRNRG